MGISALSGKPGLAWLPTQQSLALGEAAAPTLVALAPCWRCWDVGAHRTQQFPAVLSQGTGIGWSLHQPAWAEGKWCQGLREKQAGAQSPLGRGFSSSAASLSSVPGRTLGLFPSHSHHQGHPATPVGCPRKPQAGAGVGHALTEPCFISSAAPGISQHGTSKLRYPAGSCWECPEGKGSCIFFLPAREP